MPAGLGLAGLSHPLPSAVPRAGLCLELPGTEEGLPLPLSIALPTVTPWAAACSPMAPGTRCPDQAGLWRLQVTAPPLGAILRPLPSLPVVGVSGDRPAPLGTCPGETLNCPSCWRAPALCCGGFRMRGNTAAAFGWEVADLLSPEVLGHCPHCVLRLCPHPGLWEALHPTCVSESLGTVLGLGALAPEGTRIAQAPLQPRAGLGPGTPVGVTSRR